jgi:hypothetical protein
MKHDLKIETPLRLRILKVAMKLIDNYSADNPDEFTDEVHIEIEIITKELEYMT